VPLEQEQALPERSAWGAACELRPAVPVYAGQDRLLPLAEPSRHTKTSPSQWEIPPFLPEQGVFLA
jgi:hypothetical protein